MLLYLYTLSGKDENYTNRQLNENNNNNDKQLKDINGERVTKSFYHRQDVTVKQSQFRSAGRR